MDVLLIILVGAIAILGLFKVIQFGSAIRDITAQVERAKVQLTELSRARNAATWKISELTDENSEQRSRTDGLQEQLEKRSSAASKVSDDHSRRLAWMGQSAADLRTALAKSQQAIQQLQEELGTEQRARLKVAAELERQTASLREDTASENSRQRQSVRHQIQRAGQEAREHAATAKQDLTAVQQRLEANDRALGQRLAGLESSARDVERGIHRLDKQLMAISGFVRSQLDDDAGGVRAPVLVAAIHAALPAAVDILPVFFDDLCRALSAQVIFREPGDLADGRFYVRWHARAGSVPRQELRHLLGACVADGDESAPGVRELRSLLIAVCHVGPAAVQFGPLVAVRAAAGSVGGLLAEGESGNLASLVTDQGTLLEQLDPECQVDLTSLAARFVS